MINRFTRTRTQTRKTFMNWWTDRFRTTRHLTLQLGVGRVSCWYAGHERGRSSYCDYCGKHLTLQP